MRLNRGSKSGNGKKEMDSRDLLGYSGWIVETDEI